MRTIRRTIGWIVGAGVAAILAFLLWASARGRPQDLPWTPLDLGQPAGLFTAGRLAALGRDPAACRALLDRAGVRYSPLPARRDSPQCGYADGLRLATGGARRIAMRPAGVGIACPVAAALAMWEWDVVQPAARRHFGASVVASTISAATIAATSPAAKAGASMRPPTRSTWPASGWGTGRASWCCATGKAPAPERRSCAKSATARAASSRRRCRRTTTPPMSITSTSTRPIAARWGGGRAARG